MLKIKSDNKVVFEYDPGSQKKLLKQKRNNFGKQYSFKFQHVAWEDSNKLPTPSHKARIRSSFLQNVDKMQDILNSLNYNPLNEQNKVDEVKPYSPRQFKMVKDESPV